MPTLRKACAWPGCPEVVPTGTRHCEIHAKLQQRMVDERRPSAAKRGYDHRWRKLRKQVLAEEPLCRECLREGRVTAAEHVDHIDGDVTNMRRENLQSLCPSHHSAKTAREQGGFGNKPQR